MTTPELAMAATAAFDDIQVADELTGAVVPSLYFAVAVSCSVAPTPNLALGGDTETETSDGGGGGGPPEDPDEPPEPQPTEAMSKREIASGRYNERRQCRIQLMDSNPRRPKLESERALRVAVAEPELQRRTPLPAELN